MTYGFGLLLASEMERLNTASDEEVADFLARWFEPQPEMDRKVEICGSAMFHAISYVGYPKQVLRGIVRYWLKLRNWSDTAHFALAGYVVRSPDVFVEVAEEFWTSSSDSGAAQEFLRAAFMSARDNPAFQPFLAKAIQRWMSFVHPLGPHILEP